MPYLFSDRSSNSGPWPSKARSAGGQVSVDSISGREIPSSGERHFAPTGFLLPFQRLPDSVFFHAAQLCGESLGLAWSTQ
jgi:hypothetical protein